MNTILIAVALLILILIAGFVWFIVARRRSAEVQAIRKNANATGQPPSEEARLEITSGELVGSVIPIVGDFSIGRGRENQLQLSDLRVSRQHARLRNAQGAWYIQDQKSSGGTMVNGKRVPAARLNPGDQIQLGNTLMIFRQGPVKTPLAAPANVAGAQATPAVGKMKPIIGWAWILAAVAIMVVIALAMMILLMGSTFTFTPLPIKTATLLPTNILTATSTSSPSPTSKPVVLMTPTTACNRWDQITPNMIGETVCVYGIIVDLSSSRQIATRYKFSDQPNTFFLYNMKYVYSDPSSGKSLGPGMCITLTGRVQSIQGTPYIDIESAVDGLHFFHDASSCQ